MDFYDFSSYILHEINEETSPSVVIVDIDEKSLQSIGQWPWPRIILAELLDKISSAHPSAIGLDILLPERDRTSPLMIKGFYKKYYNLDVQINGLDERYFNNDVILGESIKRSEAVLSYYLGNSPISDTKCENIYNISESIELSDIFKYEHIMCNSDIIQKSSIKQGFVNKYVDYDGILRQVPLIVEYKDEKLASLPLVTLLSIDDSIEYSKNKIKVLNHTINLSDNASVLLNYYSPSWYKKISAIDLLSMKNIDNNLLAGKIVLIGSSSVALHDRVVVPQGKEIAGVQVNATVIGNILDDSLIVQPEIYKLTNFILSFLLSILLLIILLKKSRIWIVLLFVTVVFIGIFYSLIKLDNYVYVSIGYLFIPFLIYFFTINLLAIVIDVLEKKLYAEELNKSQIALFDSMVHVAEAHDVETGEHIVRTKQYVKLIANSLYAKGLYREYLTPSKINIMYQTSALHDIGKVGVSDLILKKKGKLTYDEFTIMKTHSKLGKNIIDNAISSYKENDFFITASNIVYYHHEKFDGTGYPVGLKGEDIPLEARIMALADVYDALMSKRVYKESFSYKKTKEIIISGTGEHFDPIIVEAFLNQEEEFKKISLQYTDKI